MTGLTAVSLFAGVGGFDLALQRAGAEVVAAVEIDPAARGVLADRFPRTRLFNDVTEVTGEQLRAAGFVPERGIITGGFPCQDLSVAGRRAGLAGGRSGLFWEIDRLLGELAPAWVLLENVPGLLSSHQGRDMGAVVGALAERGYGVAYRVLDAQHFGVPQRRRRVFIVGHLGDRQGPVQVLLEPEGSSRDPAPVRETREDVAGTLGGGSGSRGWAADVERMTFVPTTAYTLTARASMDRPESGAATLVAHGVTRHRQCLSSAGVVPSTTTCSGSCSRCQPAAQPAQPSSASSSTSRSAEQGGALVAAIADEHAAENGMHTNGDCLVGAGQVPVAAAEDHQPTVARGASPVRRLTPTECERLQGFPDGWTTTSSGRPQADSARYRQMGNAVAVPVVEWIAHRIVTTHEQAMEVAA